MKRCEGGIVSDKGLLLLPADDCCMPIDRSEAGSGSCGGIYVGGSLMMDEHTACSIIEKLNPKEEIIIFRNANKKHLKGAQK